jgi:hypothetical protein
VFACLYGVPTNMSLKQAGMSFAVWMFQKAKDDRLAPMGPIILGGLLKLLDEGEAAAAEGDQQLRSLRAFTYQAVGQLGRRMPQLFRNSTDIAERFFRALNVEAPGVRASVQVTGRSQLRPLALTAETRDGSRHAATPPSLSAIV